MIRKIGQFLRLASRSVIGKLVALAVIFLILPAILYERFGHADTERQNFLLRTLQAQGRLVAPLLAPIVLEGGGHSVLDIGKAIKNLAGDHVRIKLLLRPTGRSDSFFLVAANPPLDPSTLDQERIRLDRAGILPHLDESCDGDRDLALRYQAASGAEELLTSMSPFHNGAGCWVVLTSFAADDLTRASLARPFLQAPEVRLALAFYAIMAVLIALTIAGTLFDLRSFARLARRIRQGDAFAPPSFAAIAAIPELLPVAHEFDRMVATLSASAQAMKEAAEDNAHAFKAPIAAITQSIEPLKAIARDDRRAEQAIGIIGHALSRLSNLVASVRRLDEAAAELMTARLQSVDLSRLAGHMVQAYERSTAPQDIYVVARIEPGAFVAATAESLEMIIENLLDNAVSFSPDGGTVLLSIKVGMREIRLIVEDDGPGVPPDQLASIFRRNFSYRPADKHGDHSGIGLAIVRRTVELLGGRVNAVNRRDSGFQVAVMLPRA